MNLSEQTGPKFQVLLDQATAGLKVAIEGDEIVVQRGLVRVTLAALEDEFDEEDEGRVPWLRFTAYGVRGQENNGSSHNEPGEDVYWEELSNGSYATGLPSLLPKPLQVLAACHIFRRLEDPARVELAEQDHDPIIPSLKSAAGDASFLSVADDFLVDAGTVLKASRAEASLDRELPASPAARGGPRL